MSFLRTALRQVSTRQITPVVARDFSTTPRLLLRGITPLVKASEQGKRERGVCSLMMNWQGFITPDSGGPDVLIEWKDIKDASKIPLSEFTNEKDRENVKNGKLRLAKGWVCEYEKVVFKNHKGEIKQVGKEIVVIGKK